jgi:hypothetical protein
MSVDVDMLVLPVFVVECGLLLKEDTLWYGILMSSGKGLRSFTAGVTGASRLR